MVCGVVQASLQPNLMTPGTPGNTRRQESLTQVGAAPGAKAPPVWFAGRGKGEMRDAGASPVKQRGRLGTLNFILEVAQLINGNPV